MTTAPPDSESKVSRARYVRERLAREEAESLLEAKSRALFDVNRALVAEAEALRNALVEVEHLRARKQAALRTQSVLFSVLDAVSGAKTPGGGLRALLGVVLRNVSCDAVAVIEDADAAVDRNQIAVGRLIGADPVAPAPHPNADLSAHAHPDTAVDDADGEPDRPIAHIGIVAALPADLTGMTLTAAPGLMDRPRRLPDLARAGWSMPRPDGTVDTDPYRSMMLAPLRLAGERPLALVCLSRQVAEFAADDLVLLERIAQVAADPLGALRLSQRNAALAALIEGTPLPEDNLPSGIDVPFQSVNRAFERLTKAQALTVDILNDLLSAPSPEVNRAIARALARLGEDSGAIHSFLLGDQPATTPPSHDWWRGPAPSPLPDLTGFVPRLQAGIEVVIDTSTPTGPQRTLLVPALTGGQLVAVLGHSMPDTTQTFLPGEVHLLRSVAHAMHAILRRTAAESESRAAAEALATERNRLALTLSALPDLVLELDADGRFTDYHSGGIHVSQALVDRFNGYTLEQALPPDLASTGRGILTELATTGQSEPRHVQFDFGSGPRWLQVNAVARGKDARDAPAGYLMVLRDITKEREQADEIARLSEVARRTTNLVVVTDANRRITWVNRAFETSTGWTLDEVRGKNPGTFLQSDRTDAATRNTLRDALNAGRAVQVELLNRNRWGMDYWLQIDIQPLQDSDGTVTGFMAVQTDITVIKAQELALEYAAAEAERARVRLTAAVDALQDGFALYDADDVLVLCNQRYRDIYPLSAPAMVPGTRFEDILRYGLVRGEYRAAIGREEEWLAERLAAHRAPANEMEQLLQDGRWLRVYERATPDGGRVGLRVDITALKEAEARALADRAAAMDGSRDAIAITGADCRILYANAAYANLTEAPGSLAGRDWQSLFAPDVVAHLRTTVLGQLEREGTWQGDVTGQLAHGAAVDLDISLTRRNDGAVLWIMRDLSERRRAEAERDRLREDLQLAQRREVIGQLSAGLAHDFNNLIAAISGSAGLISTETGTAAMPRILGHAARILRAANQAEALVRRLLALGKRETQTRQVDLAACLREAVDLLRPGLPKTLRLVADLPDQPLLAEADPTDILQLVLNLGLNARDAMADHPPPPGGHVLTIGLAAGPCAPGSDAEAEIFGTGALPSGCPHACISVMDTGPGLTAETAARAFTPYFTSKGAKGSGLGLGIVRGITLSAQGALALSRGPEGGARFTVRWPLQGTPVEAQMGSTPANADEPAANPPAQAARLDGKAVLLVDDADDVLAVWTSILEKAGAEVAPAADPADILDVLAEDPAAFDVLVTDFDMPGMTGADLARAAHAIRPNLPVVLVTALPDWHGRDRAGAADPGFAAVLRKPVTAQALVAGVLTALGSTANTAGA